MFIYFTWCLYELKVETLRSSLNSEQKRWMSNSQQFLCLTPCFLLRSKLKLYFLSLTGTMRCNLPWQILWSFLSNISSRRSDLSWITQLLLEELFISPCPSSPYQTFRRTTPLELCDALKENGAQATSSTHEVLVAQAAQLLAIHIKVLEGNVGGINLVNVHDLLQPIPHLEFTPELGVWIMRPPACITRHHHWSCGHTSEGNQHVDLDEIICFWFINFGVIGQYLICKENSV